ncbi:MAG: HemK2/MTQ2 family protein methyltransferase [Nitrososphaerales archaeon]
MNKSNDCYRPSDDTFLLAGYVEIFSGERALEIAAGTGYLSNLLKEKFSSVVATDVNPDAIREVDKSIHLVCCDSASAVVNFKFDLIVINPPYLLSQSIEDVAVDGGKDGTEVTLKMLEDAIRLLKCNGTILFVTSSLANYNKLLAYIRKRGYKTDIVATKKFDYEQLFVIEAKR